LQEYDRLDFFHFPRFPDRRSVPIGWKSL